MEWRWLGSRSEYLMGEAQFLKNIGFRIQYFRKKANLSQEQLAEKSDLSYSTISHIESTTCYTMSLRTIFRIAGALDVHPYQLLKFDWLRKYCIKSPEYNVQKRG